MNAHASGAAQRVWSEFCGKNEVIIAVDSCDARCYLHGRDFTNVSADSMNKTCPHQRMTFSTFSPSIGYFIKFTSSLLTHVSAECVCVCAFLCVSVSFPHQLLCWLSVIFHPVQPSHVVYEIAQQDTGRSVCVRVCVCVVGIENATPLCKKSDCHVVIVTCVQSVS